MNFDQDKFEFPEDPEAHECKSFRNGDWIIFRCPKCPDYERRINWRTGKMKVKNDDPHINHRGQYFPVEYKEIYENLN